MAPEGTPVFLMIMAGVLSFILGDAIVNSFKEKCK
jgi:hypothetical protein